MKHVVAGPLDYLGRMWKMRYFLFSLVGNDLRARYRRSYLGIGWSLVRPLSMTAIFCVIFQKIFQAPVGDYLPFVLTGMTVWQFLTECLTVGCHSFERGSAYIRQQPLPLAIFPLRSVMASAFHSVIAFAVALVVTWYFRGFSNIGALLLMSPALVLLFFLGWFMAILSAIAQSHFPDTAHLLEVVVQFLFYLTPIIYPPAYLQGRGRLSLLLQCNPFSYLLELIRTPVVDATMPSLLTIQISVGFVMAMGLMAWAAMRQTERTLVFWV
jgi:ABC-type polysaccharide/polyol phosphate export permease